MKEKFPIIDAGYIFNEFPKKKEMKPILTLNEIEIDYPCRLDAMAINPAAVVYDSKMIFTPGEVVISLNIFINVKVKVISNDGGLIKISSATKRKSLVKHSYLLMCDALNIKPTIEIEVIDENIPKHCGFGSSSSTITAVATAINEIYGNPINHDDLIKYLASNHGEEVTDNDDNRLKVVQCIGGGATNGLTSEGVIIIAGKSTKIAKMFYEGEVLICIPKDFVQKDAKVLMELEEENLWKFKKTGDLYAEKIAYNLLHKALPGMANGSIKELADVVFDYRFNMGSNENCSFVYDGLTELGNKLRCLYEDGNCDFLALSSVGPAFFVIVNNEYQKLKCKAKMEELNLDIIETSIYNRKYIVNRSEKSKVFWQNELTNNSFENRPPSKYITNVLDKIVNCDKLCIDIGCGGGRYSKYLINMGCDVLAVDKYEEMIGNAYNKHLNYITASMDKIPVKSNSYDIVLSIGVIHNAISLQEYCDSLKEIYRILVNGGTCILSVFTNHLITDDLKKIDSYLYEIKNRPSMILLSKKEIQEHITNIGFKEIKEIDEHITDVGDGGQRYVYTLLFKK